MQNAQEWLVPEGVKDTVLTLVYSVNYITGMARKVYDTVPGVSIIYNYIKDSHQNDPFRTLLEILMIIFLVWYFNRNKYRIDSKEIKLTEKEIQELCEEWEPEPFVPELSEFEKSQLEKLPVQSSAAGLKVKLIDGKERINLTGFNYMGLLNRDEIKTKAVEALRKYGVGSCGPPGFYGTIGKNQVTLDVHVELEKKLADFFGMENAIIYSQGFSTIASAIPAFAKRGDILVADQGVSLAIQKGLDISRGQISYFDHNDMDSLEKTLKEIEKNLKNKKNLPRKFLVVEGLYLNTGQIANLPRLIELKKKYKYRLIVEESYSFGAVGKTGKGVSEYFNIPTSEIDILAASMCNVLGSSGGFVCGSNEIVEHQRLSGQAYTFSASLPALLAVSAIEALEMMQRENPASMAKLIENTSVFRQVLTRNASGFDVEGNENSPIIHLKLHSKSKVREDDEKILQEVVDSVGKDGFLISRAKYVVSQELKCPSPSIRITLSSGLQKRDVERAANVIRDAFKRIIRK